MPVTALSAAAIGGGLQSLWSYNRTNYMFDVPLQQGRVFQAQNIQLTRFALFREDVRDMAALTIDKVSNYMLVNTLKLGFIVAVFFNFDRTDEAGVMMTYEEKLVNMLFSISMSTAFFWLVTSVYFSMHAVILSQTLMTKMLLQVVRIPIPTEIEIRGSATTARDFEQNFSSAFRVPFLRPETTTTVGRSAPPDEDVMPTHIQSIGSSNYVQATSSAGAAAGSAKASEVPDGPLLLRIDEILRGLAGEPSDLDKITGSTGGGGVDFGICGGYLTVDYMDPHKKLVNIVRSAWAPYDVYGKISMEIGTACFLSGLAYFAIYYLRSNNSEKFLVQDAAWVTFGTLSALAWWGTMLDLAMPPWGHICVALVMLLGPLIIWLDFGMDCLYWCETHWSLSFAFWLQTMWVLGLSWSAFTVTGRWPQLWRSSLFVNVMHCEEQLRVYDGSQNLGQWGRAISKAFPSKSPDPCSAELSDDSSDVSSSEYSMVSDGESVHSGASVSVTRRQRLPRRRHRKSGRRRLHFTSSQDPESLARMRIAAGPVLRCLDAALSSPFPDVSLKRRLRLERQRLRTSCQATGLNAGAAAACADAAVIQHIVRAADLGGGLGGRGGGIGVVPVEGFWLRTGKRTGAYGLDSGGSVSWLSPFGPGVAKLRTAAAAAAAAAGSGDFGIGSGAVEAQLSSATVAPAEAHVEDLLAAADCISTSLLEDSYTWNYVDMLRLEAFGGDLVPSVTRFVKQFQEDGTQGTRIFRLGVLIMTFFWGSSQIWMARELRIHIAQTLAMRERASHASPSVPAASPEPSAVDASTWSPAASSAASLRSLLKREVGAVGAIEREQAWDGERLTLRVPAWLAPATLGCGAAGERLVLADEVGLFLVPTNGSGPRIGPLTVCDAGGGGGGAEAGEDHGESGGETEGDAIAARRPLRRPRRPRRRRVVGADFDAEGRLWAACDDGELRMVPTSPSAPSAPRLPPLSPAPRLLLPDGLRDLQLLALDSSSLSSSAASRGSPPAAQGDGGGRDGGGADLDEDRLAGIAVIQDGRLLALRWDPGAGAWRLGGTLSPPPPRAPPTPSAGGSFAMGRGRQRRRWSAAAIHGGRAVLLEGASGEVHELDGLSGRWSGPRRLPSRLSWRGLCLVPGGNGAQSEVAGRPSFVEALALGAPADERGGATELWRFPLAAELAQR